MPLIQAPSREAKKVKVTYRLDESLLYKVRRYAEFIRAKGDYVITEALNYFFDQDTDFAEWLAAHPAPPSTVHKRERRKGSGSLPDRGEATEPQGKPNGSTIAAKSEPDMVATARATI